MNVATVFKWFQVYLCFNLQHKSNQIDVFVDSKRPQYYVQVHTGCNHQAFRSILGQNEEWLDPEHFSGFSRVFFRVKDVQWCSTYEIHWKSLEHLRFHHLSTVFNIFLHLSTSQGPWCAVQRTERKAEVPPRCDSDMRHETWAGPAFLSCCTMVLWWLELIRRRSECAQLILFQQPGCIWKSSGNHLDAFRFRFDPQLCHGATEWFWRRNAPGKSERIRGVFESCSELAKRTQTASNFQRDAHDAIARETHSKFL